MTIRPEFRELSPAECREVLDRNHVGRLAFVRGRGVDIEPLGYAHKRDWLFLRSAYGAKIEALAHNPFVAFEVDEIRGPFDWRSVVAHGTIYTMTPEGLAAVAKYYEEAVEALRAIMPEALTPRDPTPERYIVYGLHIDTLSGRMAHEAPRFAAASVATPRSRARKSHQEDP